MKMSEDQRFLSTQCTLAIMHMSSSSRRCTDATFLLLCLQP